MGVPSGPFGPAAKGRRPESSAWGHAMRASAGAAKRCAEAAALAVAFALAGLAAAARGEDKALPAGFVRLDEIAPTIRQDMRYAGSFNFTGQRVRGYEAARCILWRPAGEGLARTPA